MQLIQSQEGHIACKTPAPIIFVEILAGVLTKFGVNFEKKKKLNV